MIHFDSSIQQSHSLSCSHSLSILQFLSSVPGILCPILLFDSSIPEDVDSLLSTSYIANRFRTCLPIITFALAKSTLSSSTFFFSDSNSSFFPFYKNKTKPTNQREVRRSSLPADEAHHLPMTSYQGQSLILQITLFSPGLV